MQLWDLFPDDSADEAVIANCKIQIMASFVMGPRNFLRRILMLDLNVI